MGSVPQDNPGEGDAIQGNSAALFHVQEDNLAHIGSAPLSTRRKTKKRRRASSTGAQGNLSNTRGPTVDGVVRRAKGKRSRKAGSLEANPSEEKSNNISQEGRDRETESSMLTGVPVQRFVTDICCLLKAQTTI
jgi:hypothetical protein